MSQKTKRHKLQAALNASAPVYRSYSLQPRSVDETARTVEAVITTETPVMEWDWDRYEMVPRILLGSGAMFPPNGQIPLLDSHNRYQMENQLGSARNLAKNKGETTGTLHFSETAERQWQLVREGHASDVSAGFQVISQVHVAVGATQRIQGKDYTGPINVATKWRLYEVSLTPIGADEQAKLRGFDPDVIPQQNETEFEMDAKKRAFCIERGMPNDLDDSGAALWIIDNPEKLGERKPAEQKPDMAAMEQMAASIFEKVDEAARAREEKRIATRDAFRAEVDASYELADLSHIDIAQRGYDMPNITAVREHIKTLKAAHSEATGVRPGAPRVSGEGRTAFCKDMETALVDRMFSENKVSDGTRSNLLPTEKRGKPSDAFMRMPISRIARRCLEMDGFRHDEVEDLLPVDLFRASFVRYGGEQVGLSRRDGAIHTTSSFANLTESLLNKSMRAGYTEAKVTYQAVVKIGEPVADFKKKNVYTTSAVGNLTAWPDGVAPDLASFMDYKDSYGVEAYAKMLDFTWQLFQNDDMGALNSTPFKLGNAARRTINAYAWSFVTANAALADGQAFFLATAAGNRKKANYISSGLVPTVASLGALEELMRQQVGQNTREGNTGPDILSIEPRYLITPTAVIRNTAAAIVSSVADPASSNANVKNPYNSRLEVIDEPLLAANSATAWYLAADPNLVDGIEISFLQGFESPKTWSGMDEKTLTRWFAVAQVFGGKVIDHRGWAKQAGA